MNDGHMPFLGNLLRCLQFFNATKGSSCDTLGTNIVSFGKAVLQESSLYSLARSTERGWVDEKEMRTTADACAILEQILGTHRDTKSAHNEVARLHRKMQY